MIFSGLFRAVDAVESGVHPEDVSASLGMRRGTVHGGGQVPQGRQGRVARACPRRDSNLRHTV